MHPLLAQPRSLAAYLVFWGGLSIVPWVLLHSRTQTAAWALCAASTLAFAVATLPVWYLCRALPLLPGRGWRVLSVHAGAAALFSIALLACAQVLAEVLALLPGLSALTDETQAARGAWLGVGGLFYLLVATFNYVLGGLEQRRAALEREAVLALAAQRAELSALRAQVHPHFLFNSLNTVSALIGYDPLKAREACVLLADYLRGTLGAQERALVPLCDEWALSQRYLAVEALRLGERLRLDISLEDEALTCEIPSLLLQPLIENAVTHGIAPLDDPAPLEVRARRRGQRLSLEITNGVDPAPRRKEGGLGLANVRARLYGQYGDDATLRIERQGGRFSVLVDLPASAPPPVEAP